jgi:hypothetical protein
MIVAVEISEAIRLSPLRHGSPVVPQEFLRDRSEQAMATDGDAFKSTPVGGAAAVTAIAIQGVLVVAHHIVPCGQGHDRAISAHCDSWRCEQIGHFMPVECTECPRETVEVVLGAD